MFSKGDLGVGGPSSIGACPLSQVDTQIVTGAIMIQERKLQSRWRMIFHRGFSPESRFSIHPPKSISIPTSKTNLNSEATLHPQMLSQRVSDQRAFVTRREPRTRKKEKKSYYSPQKVLEYDVMTSSIAMEYPRLLDPPNKHTASSDSSAFDCLKCTLPP